VLNAYLNLISYTDFNDSTIQKMTKETVKIAKKLAHRQYQFSCYSFLKNVCRKYRLKILKNKTDVSEKVADEIISENYIGILQYLSTFINAYEIEGKVENPIRDSYESVLLLISETLAFIGTEITIFMPYLLRLVKLYNKTLYIY